MIICELTALFFTLLHMCLFVLWASSFALVRDMKITAYLCIPDLSSRGRSYSVSSLCWSPSLDKCNGYIRKNIQHEIQSQTKDVALLSWKDLLLYCGQSLHQIALLDRLYSWKKMWNCCCPVWRFSGETGQCNFACVTLCFFSSHLPCARKELCPVPVPWA